MLQHSQIRMTLTFMTTKRLEELPVLFSSCWLPDAIPGGTVPLEPSGDGTTVCPKNHINSRFGSIEMTDIRYTIAAIQYLFVLKPMGYGCSALI